MCTKKDVVVCVCVRACVSYTHPPFKFAAGLHIQCLLQGLAPASGIIFSMSSVCEVGSTTPYTKRNEALTAIEACCS
jgi:hypothetical protein